LNAASRFLCATALILQTLGFIPAATALAEEPNKPSPAKEYRLLLHHTHTGEWLDIVYRRGNDYIPEAIARLDHYLRDHRTGAVHHFDPHLFDLLADLETLVGRPSAVIEIICGYRAPESNALLHRSSAGVASQSLHMLAQAIDIRIPEIRTSVLRDAALSLRRGGVGFYPSSDFVHVDIGRVRRW
jgi:uncharacterized protein YcbK (DUF882 family)